MPSRSNSALSSSSSERREPSLRSSVRLMFGAASFFLAFLPWATGYPDQDRPFEGSQQLNNHNHQLCTFLKKSSVTRFSFGGSCKQLVFEFLFLRQRPFMRTQSDCFIGDGFLSIRKQKAGTPEPRENLYNNTVESPHPATLPSAPLPPFSDAPLLWRLTPGAPGCRRRHKSYRRLQLMKRFCRGVKRVGDEEQSRERTR